MRQASLQSDLWLHGQTGTDRPWNCIARRAHEESTENSVILPDMIIFRWPPKTKKIFWDKYSLTGLEEDH